MNICVVLPGMPASEDEWFLPYLVDYLHRLRQHAEVTVYALKHPGRNDSYMLGDIPVRSFAGKIGLQRKVLNAILEDHEKSRFTHVHAVWANSAGFIAAAAATKLGLPFIVTLAGEELVSLPDIKYGAMRKMRTRPILRYVFTNASAIVSASSHTRDKLVTQWKIPIEKIRIIPFGVDISRFKAGQESQPAQPQILAVGGLIPVKRHSLLIRAFALFREKHPDAQLTIIGEGPLRARYERMIEGLGLSESVDLPGWIHHETMPERYRNAHIMAVTSYNEEIPVVLEEALASGLPVVSVNVGIAYDLAETVRYPVAVSSANPSDFAENLQTTWSALQGGRLSFPDDAARMEISSDRTVERMLELFHETPS